MIILSQFVSFSGYLSQKTKLSPTLVVGEPKDIDPLHTHAPRFSAWAKPNPRSNCANNNKIEKIKLIAQFGREQVFKPRALARGHVNAK